MSLPPFPLDDYTLNLIEEACNAAYSQDDAGNIVLVGSEFSLDQILEFLSGPSSYTEVDTFGDTMVVERDQPCYSERDLLRALIKEVRRLREHSAEDHSRFPSL